MLDLHPKIIEKDGRRESVVLPYEEFEALRELAEDQEDLQELRAAKARNETDESIPLEEVERRFELRTQRAGVGSSARKSRTATSAPLHRTQRKADAEEVI